jgi:hypothetical protein
MECHHLEELHKLCPHSTQISITIKNPFEPNYIDSLKLFNNLSSLKIQSNIDTPELFEFLTDYLKNKEKKLEIFSVLTLNENICEFLEEIFENTDLREFQRISLSFTKEESKIISNWLKKNTSLNSLSLNRSFI